jgi:hypothetical protein
VPESDGSQYGTWLGFALGRVIHYGLLARLDPDLGPRSFASLRTEIGEVPPRPGLNADTDNLVYGALPFVWALVAALMADVEGAGPWILTKFESLLGPGEGRNSLALGGFAGVWMLRVAAAIGSQSAYRRAQQYLNRSGGLNPDFLWRPPDRGGHVMELHEWDDHLRHDAVMVPGMSALIAADRQLPQSGDALTIGLQELLWDDRPDQGVSLARALADSLA